MKTNRVLLIDDDINTHKIVAASLKDTDWELESAMSADEGLFKVRNQSHIAVMVDYQMPDVNGLEVIEKIRNEIHLKDIPLLLISSDDLPSNILAKLNSLSTVFFTKNYLFKQNLPAKLKGFIDYYDSQQS